MDNIEFNLESYAEKIIKCGDAIICRYRDENVGIALFYANNNEFSYLTNIAVKEVYRKKGIGSLLIKRCIESSVKKSYKAMRLEVSKKNLNAISLYEKFGFIAEDVSANGTFYMCSHLEECQTG